MASRKRAKAQEGAAVVVALGGSGGDAGRLLACLAQLDPGPSAAVVVMLQLREALDEDAFRGTLLDAGRELTLIEDGGLIERGRTYMPAPDVIVTVEKGHFQTRPAQQEPGARGTIDSFLVSLAHSEEGHCIAVLFASTGGDGTLGAAAVKEASGLVLAEINDDAANHELASSNSAAALADVVVPASELAGRVKAHLEQLAAVVGKLGDPPEQATAARASIVAILRNKTGHDFHGYKEGTFWRRVQRRMQVLQTETVDDYLGALRADHGEPQNLFNDLLIGVTQFFRDRKEFELVQTEVIPKLFEGKTHNDQVRIWVIGCSTGEEAYSLAILMREYMGALEDVPHVQVFATDLDGRALAAARAGRYSDALAKDMPPERLARWFLKQGNTYVVTKELREMCIFSQHSIIKDAPFSRLDMISCRNLLIYLDPELQTKVIPLFHFALRPGGVLFLGSSENVSRHTSLFSPIENRSRIFRRLNTDRRVLPDFSFTAVDRRFVGTASPQPALPATIKDLGRMAERVADRHAPAYVIVDRDNNVLHFSGRTGRFIDPAGGAASLNVLNLVHPALRLDLRSALEQSAEARQAVRTPNLKVGLNGDAIFIDLVVEPVQDNATSAPHFVVVFKDVATPIAGGDSLSEPAGVSAEHVHRLEAELRTTTERLQATVEELESTNEELKSANEEYQSLNEELQSANEELETSKEELQSINEELTTVNSELAHRVQELGRANSDLKNFLESTQIATVFLDHDLRVMNYTPATTDIFHLVNSDLGRPLSHIKSQLAFDDLQDEVNRVLRTLGTVEREVANPVTGARYAMRILPYRSTDNFIAGVVVTFLDITERKKAEEALRDREERFRAVADLVPDLLWSGNAKGSAEWFNQRWLTHTGLSLKEAQGEGWLDAAAPIDREKLAATFRASVWSGEPLSIEYRMSGRDGTDRWFLMRAQATRDPTSGEVTHWFGSATDIHDQRLAMEAVQESEAESKLLLSELQHRVRNTLAVVRSIVHRTGLTSTSVEDYAMHLDGRLNAFARVQAVVTRNPQEGIDLEYLLAEELNVHRAREGEQVNELHGPRVLLQSKAAELLGLAIHELTVNAVKYGALASDKGRLEVNWTLEPDGDHEALMIRWHETGVDLPAKRERTAGFGTELLERTLSYELGGDTRLTFNRDGITCLLTIPATDRLIARRQPPP